MTRTFRRAVAAALLAVLAACSGGKDKGDPVDRASRLPVLIYEQEINADPALSELRVTLPAPFLNQNWPQAGGAPGKAMHHISLPLTLSKAWERDVGDGDDLTRRLISPPVVLDGRLFVIDADSTVTALSAVNGNRLWTARLVRPDESDDMAFGGGVAADGTSVYAVSGFGLVAAYDAASGNQLWRQDMGVPLRGEPTISGGTLFVLSLDNQLFALNAQTGETQWEAVGLIENAGLLGTAAPAATRDTLVVGFSSGELNAIRTENGRVTWQDSLARTTRLTALAALTDIDGAPVIDRGRVFAVGHGGRMVAMDLATGQRVWEQNIGGTNTPWVAGDFVYIVSNDAELFCLTRSEGRVRWVTQLQRYDDPEDRDGLVRWQGPVLASDRLVLTSSNGYVASVSPYTGDLLSVRRLSGSSYLPPIVADNMLYVMTKDAKIVAFR